MMPEFSSFAKSLMGLGVILIIVGAVLYFGGKFTSLGRLPGDIHIERGNFSFYFPIVTCIVVSIVLSIIFNIFSRR